MNAAEGFLKEKEGAPAFRPGGLHSNETNGMRDMRLAITGGAGFLGYHLCNKLSGSFSDVIALDMAPIDSREYPRNVKGYEVDVRESGRLVEMFKGVDVVIHAATALPLRKRDEIFDINVNGTRGVLEAARVNDIERIIYISSTAVYGIPKENPVYEDAALCPMGPYSESKIEAERICGGYRGDGLGVTIVRPKTFIGPSRLGIFQILYDWVESGKKIPVIGSGMNRYQLLDVEDLTEAISLLIQAPLSEVNGVFNIGAGSFGTVFEDVGSLCEYASTGARVMPIPAKTAKLSLALLEKARLSPIYNWVYNTADIDNYVSTEKARKSLGWTPKYSNSQSLIRSYKWYMEHKSECPHPGITHRAAWSQGALRILKIFF
ncbi:MAG: NAD(P)-dependent oxidoreductase [Candidatus Omnitrophota bacterium]